MTELALEPGKVVAASAAEAVRDAGVVITMLPARRNHQDRVMLAHQDEPQAWGRPINSVKS